MRLRWSKRALKQFVSSQDYIAQENPAAAQVMAKRVNESVELLLNQPTMGRLGRIAGTREWVVQNTPYIIAYRISEKELQIARVIHSKQLWPIH